MPNHVKNIVKMKGIENLLVFKEEEGEQCLDFNKIIPMPETLNIDYSSMTNECILYYLTERCTIPVTYLIEKNQKLIMNILYIKNDDKLKILFVRVMEKVYNVTEPKRNKMYQMGQTYVENYQKYGYTTWYDWRIANWGTKWNAYCNKQVDENTISFNTAWSNPEPVMLKLSKMYPDTVIEHWWADEDKGMNAGHRIYYNGTIVDRGSCDECSEEAYIIFAKCWED